jgi:hypothetical protein
MNTWTLTVEEDTETGDSIITFPPDLIEAAGWKIGDSLSWIDQGDGSYQLIKEDLTTFIKKGIIKDDNN